MATIYSVWRCLTCGFIMEVRNRCGDLICPACHAKMSFITTVTKKD